MSRGGTTSPWKRYAVVSFLGLLVVLAGCGQLLPAPPSHQNDYLTPDLTYTNGTNASEGNGSTASLEVHHIDVDGGESTLVITPEGDTVLIDTGPREQDGERVIEYLEGQNVTRIDRLVATHSDSDHIGGHADVIRHFETEHDGVGTVYQSNLIEDTALYSQLQEAADQHGVSIEDIYSGQAVYSRGSMAVLAVSPPSFDVDGSNGDRGLSLLIEYGNYTELVSAGTEEVAESHMVANWGNNLESDVYHLGSGNLTRSSTGDFIQALQPSVVVVSRPESDVSDSDRVGEIASEQYWTEDQGHIVVTTDGEDFQIETQR